MKLGLRAHSSRVGRQPHATFPLRADLDVAKNVVKLRHFASDAISEMCVSAMFCDSFLQRLYAP